jgi:hypothetical protein
LTLPVVTGKETLNRFSRFRGSAILRDTDGTEFFETYHPPEIPERPDDRFHEIGAGESGRLDLVSHRYYGTAELWWVIALANDLFEPLKEAVPGLVVRVPSSEYVFGGLLL